MIYINGQEIGDVYVGSQAVDEIYNGSQLVYSSAPFEPNTVLINTSGSTSQTRDLPKGYYYVEIIGCGGTDAYGQEGYFARRRGGASGARFSANMQVSGNHTLAVSGGSSYGSSSVLTIDGTRVATAGGGGNYTSVGTVNIGSTSIAGVVFSNVTSVNGNAGQETYVYGGGGSPSGGATVSTLGNYGHGQSNNPTGQYTNGIVYLKYIGKRA